jgi:hypothetical protein
MLYVICFQQFSPLIVSSVSSVVSNPWFLEPNPGNLVYGAPSQSQLVVRLNVYMSPTWRGIDPDRRYTANIPPLPDRAWEDPISIPSTQKIYPSPK